jgi:hypothetical protein
MPLPKWLDRIWLWLIAISFCIFVPLFTLVWIERVGWLTVALFVAACFAAGFYRGLPSSRQRRDL